MRQNFTKNLVEMVRCIYLKLINIITLKIDFLEKSASMRCQKVGR